MEGCAGCPSARGRSRGGTDPGSLGAAGRAAACARAYGTQKRAGPGRGPALNTANRSFGLVVVLDVSSADQGLDGLHAAAEPLDAVLAAHAGLDFGQGAQP